MLLVDGEENGSCLKVGEPALLWPTPTDPIVLVVGVKRVDFTNFVPPHDSWRLLPHESKPIPEDLHGLSVSLSILLGLNLGSLTRIPEDLSLLLKAFRTARSFFGSLGWFVLGFSFSFTTATGQLELT